MGEPGPALSTLHVDVRGRVQGVGFRWFVRERARALGLTGWVRNHPNGCVEVLAIGSDSALEELRAFLAQGPAGAQVSGLECRPDTAQIEPLDPFGILR
jgi:acylphosphatase